MASKRVKPARPRPSRGRPVYVEDRDDRPEPVKVTVIDRPKRVTKQPTMSERIAKADHNFM